MALALVMPKRWHLWTVPLALLFGVFIGLVRMVQGAHFLSDVIFAGLFTVAVILALHALMLRNWQPGSPKSPTFLRILFPHRPA
ncbi:MAG: phosphatase PAP2 family protein [Alphaproteobacteria bacterium]|nr:MAG: phosphatase PAP2 family protein [Alphaproteobacteria bacterium]